MRRIKTLKSKIDNEYKFPSGEGQTPCYRCGRPVNEDSCKWLHVVNGGTHIARPDEDYNDEASDLGLHPIGPTCSKNIPDSYLYE